MSKGTEAFTLGDGLTAVELIAATRAYLAASRSEFEVVDW